MLFVCRFNLYTLYFKRSYSLGNVNEEGRENWKRG